MKQTLGRLCFCALLCLAVGMPAWAIEPKEGGSYLDQKEFAKPELVLGSSHEPLEQALPRLPNRAAWESYLADRQAAGLGPVQAFVDPRSGGVTNLMPALPLIPGRGRGNGLTLEDMSARLGRPVRAVDAGVVADATLRFVADHRTLLGVDSQQLGAARAVQVTPDLWQVSIPQTYHGVPVRYGRLAASIDHGNLVVVGTETWGNVRGLSTVPKIDAAAAMAAGFAYAGGRAVADEVLRQPALEIVPAAQPGAERGAAFAGPIGSGYRHLLVWTFTFQRPPDDAVWEAMVDAASGEVLAFEDTNHYVDQQFTGGVYPITNTEICPNAATCGILQSGWPVPFADTGLAAPNDFTSSAGLFAYPGGTVTTTLTGRYVDIVDTCGAISQSSATGALDLGGVNGNHDCTAVGSAGNTASSRTAFYEINKLAEMARGWLPGNLWLQNRLTTNVNINLTCNAFWSPSAGTVNFYRSGGGCRNTGEIAGVFDHEWGHGLDDNDAAGVLSNSSEGYADIAAIYRLQTSCVGFGFRSTSNPGCGQTADLTGFNANEAQTGASHCDLDCSGVRDADWDRHADHTPDTALGFVCTSCLTGSGPCGRQVHCAAAPARQAAWDLVARDLQAAPFSLDSQSAFIVGNKLFYQGSGNIGAWHSCSCGVSSDGCGATNGYMQWLAADDDDGNISNGTPHMTAIFAAFNRHGIACASPTPVNSGCGGGPSTAPALSVTAGNQQAALSWGAASGATRYWVFRSEGHAGCDFGKTLIAETTGTTYTDTQVANGRAYSYNVVAAGASSACYSPVSNCTTVTPAAGPDFTLACSPSSLTVKQGQSGASTCTITSQGGFNAAVSLACAGQPAGVSCSFVPNPATPPAGGSANSSLTAAVAVSTPTGNYSFQAVGTSGALVHTAPLSLTVTPQCLAAGSLCTVNADCCSNSCKGKPGAKTCK
jgi:trimeric autotransporter adhesin